MTRLRTRWAAVLLMAALILSLTLPAFAAGPDPDAAQTAAQYAMEYGGAVSVQYALWQDGKITLSGHAGVYSKTENTALTDEHLYGVGSISKVYTAAAMMKLVEQGKIDLDKPVTAYLPDFKMADERYQQITVRMLLNHSSGLMGSASINSFLFGDGQETYPMDTLLQRLSAQRLLGAGERDGAIWFFLILLAAMALWMARGHLGALGRTAELMFAILLIAAGAVLLLALFQVRSGNLMAQWQWNIGAVGELAWPGMGVLGCGMFAAFLFQPEDMEHPGGKWLRWTTAGCLMLAAAQIIIIGCFGPELTRRLSSPFFQLAKSVGVEGAFQRVESIIVALWTFSDLILLAGILWAVRRIAAVLWPRAPGQAVVTMAVLPAAAAALALFGAGRSAEETAKIVVPMGNLVFGFGIPVLILLGKAFGKQK